MPKRLVWLFSAITLLPSYARAGTEVTFQFEMQIATSNADAESPKLGSVEIQDRAWATPGVEQATFPMTPAMPFDFTGPQTRFRFDGDGPHWLDDVCFPLTRQLFHQCERNPDFTVVICASEYIPRLETPKIYLVH
jgi:hypothetical protein